ncbi:hypothetical protein [Pseudaeromonas pectinilytica]
MDKVREDFEEWFKRDYHPDKTGPYMKDALLYAWQASRAALCVNLPTNETTWPDGTELVDRKQVETSIDAAGVSYS